MGRNAKKTYIRTRAPSEDSDQTAHSHSLIRTLTGRIVDNQGCNVSSRGQRWIWSDCEDAHIYFRLRWALVNLSCNLKEKKNKKNKHSSELPPHLHCLIKILTNLTLHKLSYKVSLRWQQSLWSDFLSYPSCPTQGRIITKTRLFKYIVKFISKKLNIFR